MRTPQEAYDEVMRVLQQRHASAERSIVPHKPSYQLGLFVAMEQLKLSFNGVLDKTEQSNPQSKP